MKMRCDQAKWVWTREKIKSQFHLQCMLHLQRYIMQKTPSKLNIRIQKYSHFNDAQNNKIQRKLNAIIGSIWKSITASSDSFCLIASQMSFFHTCKDNQYLNIWNDNDCYMHKDMYILHTKFSPIFLIHFL